MPDDLYHSDILGWSRAQADRLRRLRQGERVNDLDWEHVIEEIEDVGKGQLDAVRSLLALAIEHALKASAWPDHAAARKWRNEAATFLGQARQRYEPGMAQHLELARLYADALTVVRSLDMRRPGRRLPEPSRWCLPTSPTSPTAPSARTGCSPASARPWTQEAAAMPDDLHQVARRRAGERSGLGACH
jgi:hypothetical protein